MLSNLIKPGINIVFGPPASGKSTLAMCIASEMLNQNKKVIYIDTELKFSSERFMQIHATRKNLENFFLIKAPNFKEQQLKIKMLTNVKNLNLVVIDTINPHYRKLIKRKRELANKMLASQLRYLKELQCHALVLAQVYYNLQEGLTKMVGEKLLVKYASNIIRLKTNPKQILTPAGRFLFRINKQGLELKNQE